MLDERKVKLMTRLAFYEQKQGQEDFRISAYYRKDYTSFHVICSVLWITIGYACALGLAVTAGMESLLERMSGGLLVLLFILVLAGYIALVVFYIGVSTHVFSKKHKDARQRVKKYNYGLTKLLKIYSRMDAEQ